MPPEMVDELAGEAGLDYPVEFGSCSLSSYAPFEVYRAGDGSNDTATCLLAARSQVLHLHDAQRPHLHGGRHQQERAPAGGGHPRRHQQDVNRRHAADGGGGTQRMAAAAPLVARRDDK